MLEFKVNEYLSLRNNGYQTDIYVNNVKFIQCKFLLTNVPIAEITSFDDIKSIDEAANNLDHSLEASYGREYNIDPKTEFWAHCSNLQVWTENNYDTRLLHRNISFPLLKRLTEVGDPEAEKVFKEDIVKRMEEANLNVVLYLLEEGYLEYLTEEGRELVFYDSNRNLKETIERVIKNRIECTLKIKKLITKEMGKLIEKIGLRKVREDFMGLQKLREAFREEIHNKLEKGNVEAAIFLLNKKYSELRRKKEIENSFQEEYNKSRKIMGRLLEEGNIPYRIALLVLKELAEKGDTTAKQKSIAEFEKEFKRKEINLYNFLLLERLNREISVSTPYYQIPRNIEYYNYLDRNTMLNLLLEENDAKAVLELDELIDNRWKEFKSELKDYEKEKYLETFRRVELKPNPVYDMEQHENANNIFSVENKHIKELILGSVEQFRLVGVPEPILKLTALRKLDLDGNNIRRIPEGISKLTSLKELTLKRCSIKILTESIGELRHLEQLDLSSNIIESLPSSFSNLDSLRVLDISRCKLTIFPEEICMLKALEKLSVSGNELKTLPKSISQLRTLKSLSIHGNNLTTLPNEIGALESLSSIDIAHNPLEKLPETILKLDNLYYLHIDASQRELYPLKELKQKRKKQKKKFYMVAG